MSRIAIVTPEYPHMRGSFGGIAAQYSVMAPTLVELGDEVHVLVPGAGDDQAFERDGVIVRGVSVPRRTGPLFALARCAATRRALSKMGGFDMVLVADWSGNGALLPTGEDHRLVTHLHTSLAMIFEISELAGEDRGRPGLRARLQLWLERRQCERSNAILGCSRAILALAEKQWDIADKRRGVLPNVIDPLRIRTLGHAAPENDATRGGSPVIVCPGRLETRKGGHFLVRAMREVWAEHGEAILVLAGTEGILDGKPARRRVDELAGDHSDRVFLTGPLSHAELFPTLAAADVVVTPSLWEAFGIVTLEAMALGKRVVATTGSGYEEFCEDGVNCVLVAPGDPGALARGIFRALEPESGRLEAAAAETANAFSAERRGPEYRSQIAALFA